MLAISKLNPYIFEGVRSKTAFMCLGLQLRIKRAYQIPINFSLLWLEKHYLGARSYKINLILKGPFEPNSGQIAKKALLLLTPSFSFTGTMHKTKNYTTIIMLQKTVPNINIL